MPFGNLFSKPVKDIMDSAGKIIDDISTSKEEKLKAHHRLARLIEDNITARHAADMQSDSWLSKNIRPLALIAIFFMYSAFSLADGNLGDFKINNSYVTLLGDWGKLAFGFYFGMRGLEKIAAIRKK